MAHDLHVRVGDELWERLRIYADANGMSITTALSILLAQALPRRDELRAQATTA